MVLADHFVELGAMFLKDSGGWLPGLQAFPLMQVGGDF